MSEYIHKSHNVLALLYHIVCPTKLVKMIKSITTRKIFAHKPQVKEQLWGGEFWSKGYYIGTVCRHASEDVIAQYVKDQGRDKEYTQLQAQQLKIFDTP